MFMSQQDRDQTNAVGQRGWWSVSEDKCSLCWSQVRTTTTSAELFLAAQWRQETKQNNHNKIKRTYLFILMGISHVGYFHDNNWHVSSVTISEVPDEMRLNKLRVWCEKVAFQGLHPLKDAPEGQLHHKAVQRLLQMFVLSTLFTITFADLGGRNRDVKVGTSDVTRKYSEG